MVVSQRLVLKKSGLYNSYLPKKGAHYDAEIILCSTAPCAHGHGQENSVLGSEGFARDLSLRMLWCGVLKSHKTWFPTASAQHKLDLSTFGGLYFHVPANLRALQRSSGVPGASKAEPRMGELILKSRLSICDWLFSIIQFKNCNSVIPELRYHHSKSMTLFIPTPASKFA